MPCVSQKTSNRVHRELHAQETTARVSHRKNGLRSDTKTINGEIADTRSQEAYDSPQNKGYRVSLDDVPALKLSQSWCQNHQKVVDVDVIQIVRIRGVDRASGFEFDKWQCSDGILHERTSRGLQCEAEPHIITIISHFTYCNNSICFICDA